MTSIYHEISAHFLSDSSSHEGHKYWIYRNVWDKFVSILSIGCSFDVNLVVCKLHQSKLTIPQKIIFVLTAFFTGDLGF